jgi:hypothetical protein
MKRDPDELETEDLTEEENALAGEDGEYWEPPESDRETATNIRKHTEKELLEKLQKQRSTTTFYRKLDAIKHNLDVVILLLHTVVVLVAGILIGLAVAVGGAWLYVGGSLVSLAAFATFFIKIIAPRGRLAKTLDNTDFKENLKKLEEGITQFFKR